MSAVTSNNDIKEYTFSKSAFGFLFGPISPQVATEMANNSSFFCYAMFVTCRDVCEMNSNAKGIKLSNWWRRKMEETSVSHAPNRLVSGHLLRSINS